MKFLKLFIVALCFATQIHIQGVVNVHAQQADFVRKSPNSTYIATIQMTPFGLLAGENDLRVWQKPFNGLFLSSDFGETWKKFGLDSKGITDIAYIKGRLYVTTRQILDGKVGLFTSQDKGETWDYEEIMNFGMFSVAAYENTVVVGGASHGLWISFDNGNTWKQKIGDIDTTIGPDIFDIALSKDLFLATGRDNLYISNDGGHTWDTVSDLKNKGIKNVSIGNNIAIVGANNSTGIYTSFDFGQSWIKNTNWGNYKNYGIAHYKNTFYAGRINSDATYSVFQSKNLGVTWENLSNTDKFLGRIIGFTTATNTPDYLFMLVQNNGIYRHTIKKTLQGGSPFLDIPWNFHSSNELIDKITAFFDHSYPLLGYRYHKQPSKEVGTTTNYMGQKASAPTLYYDTHNGTDFVLDYGAEIKAPAAGYATYYYCTDCGHSIKIDHQNGYQTTYMHLQEDGLIATNNIPVWVNKDLVIGKVGLTGRTNKPHLHFTVIKDQEDNKSFIEDYPAGLVDPFGWQNNNTYDPWRIYTWQDTLGIHTGTKSEYLWNTQFEKTTKTISDAKDTVVQDNKTVFIDKNDIFENTSFYLFPYIKPTLSKKQKNLKYLANTSFILSAYNYVQEKVTNLQNPIEIEIDFSNVDLQKENIKPETLKIYYFNTAESSWEPLTTIFLDLIGKKIRANTQHLSQFAVFGEKIDTKAPQTTISIQGIMNNGWFEEFPTISFSTNEPKSEIKSTFYKLGKDIDWIEYSTPFLLEQNIPLNQNGVIGIEYRSVDNANNWEDINSTLIKINANKKWNQSVFIKNATFTIANDF